MNIWIVTIGNSDVQLKCDYNTNKWNASYRIIRGQLYNHVFKPSPIEDSSKKKSWIVPARVMGMVYNSALDDETYQELIFPLLDTFIQGLLGKNQPDKIFVILTNQENIFSTQDDRNNQKCPYWHDTHTLQPILEKYFQKNFPRLKSNENIEYLELKPDSKEQSLDNWNESLLLVQHKIAELKVNKSDKIFVSHQAGTPAISSAIQFASLSKFNKQVKFLLSNEYEKGNPIYIPSSNYLKGIKLQEAKALLERYDYSGVKEILTDIWIDSEENTEEQRVNELLEMAIYWNCAKFEDFARARGKIVQERTQKRWWTGYEAAYLALVRLEQGNTVEALFHSFRSVEGLIRYLHPNPDPDNYTNIYNLIPIVFPNWESSPDMKIFRNCTRKKRNDLFHRLLGLKEEAVFQAWDTSDKEKWKSRVLGCLNFVSGEKLTSLKKASLMYDIERELQEILNTYEL